MEADELVPVFTTTDLSMAEIIRIALQNDGIGCEIENEHQAGLSGIMQVRVLVKSWDESKAKKVIESNSGG